MTTAPTDSVEIFYCYAHRDHVSRKELEKHLAGLYRSGRITGWYDGEIIPGQLWKEEIKRHLDTAQIVLLLISPDFMASDYCYSIEMRRAIERHNANEACVIPILLRPVDLWEDIPFRSIQMLPTGARAVVRWNTRDEAFEDIARGIRTTIDNFLQQHIVAPVEALQEPVLADAITEHITQEPSFQSPQTDMEQPLTDLRTMIQEALSGSDASSLLNSKERSVILFCFQHMSERHIRDLLLIWYQLKAPLRKAFFLTWRDLGLSTYGILDMVKSMLEIWVQQPQMEREEALDGLCWMLRSVSPEEFNKEFEKGLRSWKKMPKQERLKELESALKEWEELSELNRIESVEDFIRECKEALEDGPIEMLENILEEWDTAQKEKNSK